MYCGRFRGKRWAFILLVRLETVDQAGRSHEAEYCRDGPWAVSFKCRILYRYKSLRTSQFVRQQGGIEF